MDRLTRNGISIKETDLLANTTGIKSYVGQIDYSLSANLLMWRVIEPENALYVMPIQPSAENVLGIKRKSLLLRLNKSASIRLSIDWIHNLVFYNIEDKIIAFNLTQPLYGYIVINEMIFNTILDLAVNPMDSLLFWSVSDNSINRRGRIMRASEDGSNQTVLIDTDLREPIALAVDLELKRLYWIDRLLFQFYSVDFNGNDMKSILKSHQLFKLSYYMTIFGDDIYWSNYFHSAILKTNKFGLNGTQINYLIKTESGSDIESIAIIDPSLQPFSTNRCFQSKCSHLCLPINQRQYHCVCPQINFNTRLYPNINCIESIHTISERSESGNELTTTTEAATQLLA
ncbi:unnamed protein product [Medioppia subpectinata]|uniref:Uncharacterized protein n=1 Tax=Medioppia subpectinata TaxID=1979941 RepID=A0A7R9L1Z4_9ACAR|nr:unnamed protein product [Medioppia subpectinata]CAG2112833.1 unnamed protein product [Medioppia subpectinata]